MTKKNANPTRKATDASLYNPREGFQEGIPLRIRVQTNPNTEPDYQFVFPEIQSDEYHSYTKSYDVLKTHYLKQGLYFCDCEKCEKLDRTFTRLLRHEHIGFYDELMFYARQRERFFTRAIARHSGVSNKTILHYLDTLENAFLVRRVRGAVSVDRVIYLVLCTPFYNDELDTGYGQKIVCRLNNKFIQNERDRVGHLKYPVLQWDYPTMIKALSGDKVIKELKDLARICEDIQHTHVDYLIKEGLKPITPEKFFLEAEMRCKKDGLIKDKLNPKMFLTSYAYFQLQKHEAKNVLDFSNVFRVERSKHKKMTA